MHSDQAAVIQEKEHYTLLVLRGDLSKESEIAVLGLRPWQEGLQDGKGALVIDFTEVPYINSAGIAVLIRLVRMGMKARFRSYAYGVTSHYQKLFRMVGLTEYMAIYPNEYAVSERLDP